MSIRRDNDEGVVQAQIAILSEFLVEDIPSLEMPPELVAVASACAALRNMPIWFALWFCGLASFARRWCLTPKFFF